MLSDRSYFKNDYPDRGRGALAWFISAIAAGFILESVFTKWFDSNLFSAWFSLHSNSLRGLSLWQFVSYGFLHNGALPFQILIVAFNLLCLYVLGKEIEGLVGTRRFVWLYLGALIFGGLTWTAVHFQHGGSVAGAWPGIAALLTLFACLNPNQPITLLVFFVAPVTLKPKHLVLGLVCLDTLGLALWEIRGNPSPLGFAHSAHLGGMLAGFLYYRYVHLREWQNPDGRAEIELPAWFKKKRKSAPEAASKYTVNLSSPEDLRAEVDRILDKINSQGFNSLTPEEKRLLDDARDQISRQ